MNIFIPRIRINQRMCPLLDGNKYTFNYLKVALTIANFALIGAIKSV